MLMVKYILRAWICWPFRYGFFLPFYILIIHVFEHVLSIISYLGLHIISNVLSHAYVRNKTCKTIYKLGGFVLNHKNLFYIYNR